jgi:hypothetical protein
MNGPTSSIHFSLGLRRLSALALALSLLLAPAASQAARRHTNPYKSTAGPVKDGVTTVMGRIESSGADHLYVAGHRYDLAGARIADPDGKIRTPAHLKPGLKVQIVIKQGRLAEVVLFEQAGE